MYKLASKLPEMERFNLISQVRSAARSVTNNIAEGYGSYYYRDNLSFQRKARGSLNELIDDINICLDEHYFEAKHLEELKQDAYKVRALLNGYMNYLSRQIRKTSEDSSVINEPHVPYGGEKDIADEHHLDEFTEPDISIPDT